MTVCDEQGRARCTPLLGYTFDPTSPSLAAPVFGDPQTISGFRLVDGRASYGVGLETFALGFPIHFDWSWRTLFNKDWEDYLFAYQGAAGRQDAAATGSARPSSASGSATISSSFERSPALASSDREAAEAERAGS